MSKFSFLGLLLLALALPAWSQEEPSAPPKKKHRSWMDLSDQDTIVPVSSVEWGTPDRWSLTARYVQFFEKDRNWAGYVRAQSGVGQLAARLGDYKAALEQLNAALATAREELAPGHLEVASCHREIGSVYVSTGRSAEGLELLGEALAMLRAAGSGPKDVVETLLRMCVAHSDQGEDDQALALLDEVEAILRATTS